MFSYVFPYFCFCGILNLDIFAFFVNKYIKENVLVCQCTYAATALTNVAYTYLSVLIPNYVTYIYN